MGLDSLFETLNKTFSYNIEMLGNSDGYIVKIWDGYGLRRAHAHDGNLESTIIKALEQYQENKQY